MLKNKSKNYRTEKPKIFERNPDTGVIRWRYVDESPDKCVIFPALYPI